MMEGIQFVQLLEILVQIKREMQRMADAAEAQVAETQSMRMLVELRRSREEN